MTKVHNIFDKDYIIKWSCYYYKYHQHNSEGIKNNCKHFVNPFENNIFVVEMNEGKQEIPLPFLFDRNLYDRKECAFRTH